MLNRATILGNVGRDPELKFTPSGKAVCNFSVATTERWTDAKGEKQSRTDWHNIVVWGKQAEACGQYLSKGRQVYVEGSIQTRSYDDKNGVKQYRTEIIARDVKFLGGGGERQDRGDDRQDRAPRQADASAGSAAPADDSEVPF